MFQNFWWRWCQDKKRIFWLPAPIILLAIVSANFCIINSLIAREVFDFSQARDIKILSDRSFQKIEQNLVEAVGNVVILYQEDTLYGERASLNTQTGQLSIFGNVRFVSADLTLYGTEIFFNTYNGHLEIINARLVNERYTLMGGKIIRPAPGLLIAEQAEYTTCKDCPESWSIFAEKAYITKSRYLTANQATIKINGVSTSYLPFLVLPLKRGRETGLLFPTFSFRPGELTFRQPWFWAISDQADMTLTPGVRQTRGGQLEGEWRWKYGGRSRTDLEWFSNADRVYLPGKKDGQVSGHHYYRYFTLFENHYQRSRNFAGHWWYTQSRDLDLIRDAQNYTAPRTIGSELGLYAFLNRRFSWFDLSADATQYQSMFVPGPLNRDPTYVQVMPGLHLSSVPWQIWSHEFPLFHFSTIWMNSHYDVFRQNHQKNRMQDGGAIRNARRLGIQPEISLGLLNVGPLELKTNTRLEYLSYEFPQEGERHFLKRGIVQKSELTFEVDRIFGVAYRQYYPQDELFAKEEKPNSSGDEKGQRAIKTLGDLPKFSQSFTGEKIQIEKASLRHLQRYRLLHFYTGKSSLQGNPVWRNQIENISGGEGLFDENDKMKNIIYNADDVQTVTALSERNTVEFRWENALIRKSVLAMGGIDPNKYPTRNFSYSKVAYFDVSQGLELNTKSRDINKDFTRLMTSTGYNYQAWGFNVTEYYFWRPNQHILNPSISYSFLHGNLALSHEYSNQSKTKKRLAKASGSLRLLDTVLFEGSKSYDFLNMDHREWLARFTYTPAGECWKSDFTLERGLLETTFSLNFLFNFDGKGFVGLERGQ